MKQQLLFFALCLVLFCSCNDSQNKETSNASLSSNNLDTNLVSETPNEQTKQAPTYPLTIEGDGYNIVVFNSTKEEYNTAKENKPQPILDPKKIHPKVKILDNGCSLDLPKEKKMVLKNEEGGIMSITYLGYLKTANLVVLREFEFESTLNNLIYNMRTGWHTNIAGTEFIVSPDAKFIFTLATDEISWSGIAVHEIAVDTVKEIIYTFNDFTGEEEEAEHPYFNPESAFWASKTELFLNASSDNYYKLEIQPASSVK